MKPEIKFVKMQEQEMFEALQQVYNNLSFSHDRKIYQQMYVLLTEMKDIMQYNFELEYPKEHLEATTPQYTGESIEFDF